MGRSLYKLKHFVSLQAIYMAIFVKSGSVKWEGNYCANNDLPVVLRSGLVSVVIR